MGEFFQSNIGETKLERSKIDVEHFLAQLRFENRPKWKKSILIQYPNYYPLEDRDRNE